MENAFVPKPYIETVSGGHCSWQAPSNIAIVKYWGKKPGQLPANPSLSLTLSTCVTQTAVAFEQKKGEGFSIEIMLDGKPKASFAPKIETFFSRALAYLPFLKSYHFTIDTRNTFPHGAGIASSASGMAALAMNLMDIERQFQPQIDDEFFYRKASFIARLGSGSACRSITGSAVAWGKHAEIDGSSDLFGVSVENVHPVFKNYRDTILLVESGEKEVSSTVGHGLMNGHPFAEKRFMQAHGNLSALKTILATGDLEKFIAITESEALTLHAMMMASQPYFILMRPGTLEIIRKIWDFRKATQIPACFTLDAGANVHLLYPENISAQVLQFIQSELVVFCENGAYICDAVGSGAKKL